MPEPGIRNHKTSIPSLLNILGNPVQIRVTVDSSVRDGGLTPDTTAPTETKLNPGLVLVKHTDGRYFAYDTDASGGSAPLADESTAVILMDFIDVEDGNRDANVAVSGGVFDRDQLRFSLLADKNGFQWNNTVLDAR